MSPSASDARPCQQASPGAAIKFKGFCRPTAPRATGTGWSSAPGGPGTAAHVLLREWPWGTAGGGAPPVTGARRAQPAVKVQRWSGVPLSSPYRTWAPDDVLSLDTPSTSPLL